MDSSTVRRRKNTPAVAEPPAEDESSSEFAFGISTLDVVRILVTITATTLALSYYLTSGASFFFNRRPWFTHPAQLQQYFRGPIALTPAQLALYNGSAPDLPIYLSINGTIFDVSASPHTYGPGGSYHVFVGKDATRAFVTGCFVEDATGDVRGAEDMYLPVDTPESEAFDEAQQLSGRDRKLRAERERRDARKRIRAEIDKWERFYRDHKKYIEVGKLVGIGEYTGPAPTLCAHAAQGRPKRQSTPATGAKSADKGPGWAPGKPVH